jgi:hypothetical protein
MDAGFIAYENIYQGRTDTLAVNVGALALDVGCAFVPLATGGGVALRGGAKAAQVESKVARAEPHVAEAVQYLHAGTKRTSQAAAQGQRLEARTHSELNAAGLRDGHHIIQNAAVKDLPGYNRGAAPAVHLEGPPTRVGSPHYAATLVQRQPGGGTYAAERRIGYKALRRGGLTPEDARAQILTADLHFESIGVTLDTATRVPRNRF